VHDRRVSEDASLSAEVTAWFHDRGFSLRVNDVGASPNDHFGVDLMTLDGRLAQRDYGTGSSETDAMIRARERYRQEQGD
jgi:hypothetical protein